MHPKQWVSPIYSRALASMGEVPARAQFLMIRENMASTMLATYGTSYDNLTEKESITAAILLTSYHGP